MDWMNPLHILVIPTSLLRLAKTLYGFITISGFLSTWQHGCFLMDAKLDVFIYYTPFLNEINVLCW